MFRVWPTTNLTSGFLFPLKLSSSGSGRTPALEMFDLFFLSPPTSLPLVWYPATIWRGRRLVLGAADNCWLGPQQIWFAVPLLAL